MRRSGTRASGPLFAWAEHHETDVHFVLLQSLRAEQREANKAEAEWKVRAAWSGIHFPSREFFGAAMRCFASTDPWPIDAAVHNSQPIEQLATKVISLASIEKSSVLCEEGYRPPSVMEQRKYDVMTKTLRPGKIAAQKEYQSCPQQMSLSSNAKP